MGFDTEQSAYKDFRETLKQHTNQVVVWAGAGLSQPAGIPSWVNLRKQLVQEALKKAEHLDSEAKARTQAFTSLAAGEKNLWLAFGHLKKALGETSYVAAIRTAFSNATIAALPPIYPKLWSLGITGFLTLNIDRFATRAYSQVSPGRGLREFDGVYARKHIEVLRSGNPFVANLHGSLENHASWIFTDEDFEELVADKGYKTLIEACLATRTMLFIGISADDQGATRHLQLLKDAGLDVGPHFWLTSRKDADTDTWAEKIGIRQIFYQAKGEDHTEINGFLDDLSKYLPSEKPPVPVTPPTARERGADLPSPTEVEHLKANEIRQILNREAKRILGSNDPNRFRRYEEFWKEYEEAVYRAWSVNTAQGKNVLFDYTLEEVIAKGAFGSVYKARDDKGNEVAIKVLHGNIREDPEMLASFRRGVTAMKILSERGVSGMVPYKAAWEIPACTVMELVHGPNLEEAVESKYIDSWNSILQIAIDLVAILRTAHQLPERVLHRDVRPPNIMLKGLYTDADRMEVVVLDFDLAWHRDASGLSVNLGKSSHGYVAPEQLDGTRRKLTRNALVDSFGLGMTLYFLASGKQPVASQHMHKDWDAILRERVVHRKCPDWRSLPRRFARLIIWATQDQQTNRWDMTRIHGELSQLSECLKKPLKLNSLELLAEEIASRCPRMVDDYAWDLDSATAHLELKSGFTIKVQPNWVAREIRCNIEWLHAGDRSYKDVKKFMGPAADKVCAQLKSGGWRILHKNVASNLCRVECAVSPQGVNTIPLIQKLADSLSQAIDILRFN